jgi:hypothetical protein
VSVCGLPNLRPRAASTPQAGRRGRAAHGAASGADLPQFGPESPVGPRHESLLAHPSALRAGQAALKWSPFPSVSCPSPTSQGYCPGRALTTTQGRGRRPRGRSVPGARRTGRGSVAGSARICVRDRRDDDGGVADLEGAVGVGKRRLDRHRSRTDPADGRRTSTAGVSRPGAPTPTSARPSGASPRGGAAWRRGPPSPPCGRGRRRSAGRSSLGSPISGRASRRTTAAAWRPSPRESSTSSFTSRPCGCAPPPRAATRCATWRASGTFSGWRGPRRCAERRSTPARCPTCPTLAAQARQTSCQGATVLPTPSPA